MDRILAFGCHPDDVEFECAGTLALLSQMGYEIHIATMAGGEMGSPTIAPQIIREQRLEEAARSTAVIGGQFHYAGGFDIEIEYNASLRQNAIRILREVDPLIVFTHPPTDYMIDHEETSRLVRNATYIASVPNYDCGVPAKPTKRIPYLYYWDATGLCDIFGRPLPLNRLVDISDVMETKIKMLHCHVSQREWLNHHDKCDDYTNILLRSARAHGEMMGVANAEGFVQHLGANYPRENILKTILGERCVER